ncbi:hypothetical protein V5799_001264 [Amblyomma americanum]|uniref:Secreted protein n=1 Tax=Amblyomma americanum TaxID=6943 RepID=A0AAQ4D0P8_AMBAM
MESASLCLLFAGVLFVLTESGVPPTLGDTFRIACPAQCRVGQRLGQPCGPGCFCRHPRRPPFYRRLFCVAGR